MIQKALVEIFSISDSPQLASAMWSELIEIQTSINGADMTSIESYQKNEVTHDGGDGQVLSPVMADRADRQRKASIAKTMPVNTTKVSIKVVIKWITSRFRRVSLSTGKWKASLSRWQAIQPPAQKLCKEDVLLAVVRLLYFHGLMIFFSDTSAEVGNRTIKTLLLIF